MTVSDISDLQYLNVALLKYTCGLLELALAILDLVILLYKGPLKTSCDLVSLQDLSVAVSKLVVALFIISCGPHTICTISYAPLTLRFSTEGGGMNGRTKGQLSILNQIQ